MTFAEILPYLEAGRRVRRSTWPREWPRDEYITGDGTGGINDETGGRCTLRINILASDWTLVDEPTVDCQDCAAKDARATARENELTRQLAELRATVARLRVKVAVLESDREFQRGEALPYPAAAPPTDVPAPYVRYPRGMKEPAK